MSTEEDYAIAGAMYAEGGSFVSALGNLWFKADLENRGRIVAAFPELWAKYAEVVKIRALQNP